MSKKREPIDLVGRLASRLSLTPQVPAAGEASAPPSIALRAAAVPSRPARSASQGRTVRRETPPRVEPTFGQTRPDGLHRTGGPVPASARPGIGLVQPEPVEAPMSEEAPPAVMAEAAVAQIAPEPADLSTTLTVDDVMAPPAAEAHAHIDGADVVEFPTTDGPAATDAIDRETAPGRKYVELNLVRLHKEGFLTPQNQRSLIAEEYRIIKRPLLRAAFDHANEPGNLNHVVMITSARPDEGKTFTAVNLATSVATERDLFVLLVDCDIRRMGLSKKLGVSDRKGLMDVLMDPTLSIADVILRTNIPNLAIIPSGQPIEAATEVFASAQMTTLVDDIASRYPDRFIIFDAPPVLASSEPGVLAVHVGQTVMVVHANETSKRAIAQSIPLINSCPNVHFVLNRATLAAGLDRFGYYGTY